MPIQTRTVVAVGVVSSVLGSLLYAQTDPNPNLVGSPFARPAVVGAPFSAQATTVVKQTLSDGTRLDRTATARYFRDSAGRVRVEHTIPSNDARDPNQQWIMVAPDPTNVGVYTVEPSARTFYRTADSLAALLSNGRNTFAIALAPNRFLLFRPEDWRTERIGRPVSYSAAEEPLGTRTIAGMNAVGRRITLTIPVGENGNDQPIDIIADQWESPELKLLVYSRYSNPHTGFLEYRLTNISRDEPASDLFVVPRDYTLKTTTADDPAMRLEFWPRVVNR